MHKKTILALGGAALALAIASPVALGAGSQVTVRVEGKKRTLLQTKSIHTRGGFITRGGAPSGACPATSGAGALDVATKHHWVGTWSTSFNDYLIKSILGDTESSSKFYWGIWINDKYATAGACGLKLHAGDRLLFAVDSVAHHEHPLAINAPGHAIAGNPFAVKVVSFSDKGKSKPLAGAHVTGAGQSVVTNSRGIAHIVASKAGTLKLGATDSRYIRAAQVRVRVGGAVVIG
jgi:uncharacterized protein DUF4430